jgi:hypothetical protein
MIKTLFLIAGLLVPGLAYAANPSAPFSVQVVDPPNGIPCDIGPSYTGSIPAAATQAGFTHCAANYDFTQTQSFTDARGTHQWSNLASWFSCNSGAGTPYLVYYGEFSNVGCDTAHYNITTDGGVQVWAMTYYQTDNQAGHLVSRLTNQGNGASATFNMAPEYYIEYVMRPTTNHVCTGFCPYSFLSTFTRVQGSPCFFGSDMEWDSGATGTGVGQSWWNFSCPNGPVYGGSCAGGTCATPINGTINTSVNTWGDLTTGDGVNKAASCNYWAPGSVNGLPASAFKSCFSNTIVPPAANTSVFRAGQPMYIYFATGPDNIPNTMTVSSVTTFIQRFTVWECPGYASGPCITNPVITTAP